MSPRMSRLLRPSSVCRMFGLKMFSTVFLWIRNLEKNLSSNTRNSLTSGRLVLTIYSPVSVPVKREHVLRDADQVAHGEGEEGDARDGEDVDTISG